MSKSKPISASTPTSQLKLNNLAKLHSKLSTDKTLLKEPGENQPPRLPIDCILKAENQPRRYFSEENLEKLKMSLSKQGLLSPIIVRPLDSGQYQLVAGERRYRAARALGWKEIPVKIMELDEQGANQVALMENLQREDLNPLEQTEGILALLEMRLERSQSEIIKLFYRLHNEHTGKVSTKNVFGSPIHRDIESIFSELGHLDWISFVVSRLPLLNLPLDLLTVLRQGKIAYTKAKAISKLKEEKVRQQFMTEAIEKKLSLKEINERIKILTTPIKTDVTTELTPQNRWKHIYEKVNKVKPWKNPQAWEKLEMLLSQIEDLVE